MQERITSIEIDVKGVLQSTNRVEFGGYTSRPSVDQGVDGKIMKTTGLEAPTMDVTGGPSSFGGSVYTGINTNDREVVLTITPTGATAKSIKNRLNALVARSTLDALRMRINTEFGDGQTSGLSEECYVTGVSAPIFDAGNTIQITVKLPRSFFERDEMRWGIERRGSGYDAPDEVRINKGWDEVVGEDRSVDFHIETEGLNSDLLNAPSPFRLMLQFTPSAGRFVKSVTFRDDSGNKATVLVGEPYSTTSLSDPDLNIEYDGGSRTIVSMLTFRTSQRENIRGNPGYATVIAPNWPTVMPGSGDTTFNVTYFSSYANAPLADMEVRSHVIWPRVFGV